MFDSLGKAELFAETFWNKYNLPEAAQNQFSQIPSVPFASDQRFLPVRTRTAERIMSELKVDSSTGPDALAARVLKHCASSLAVGVAILTRKVLHEERWPALWKEHWILPLFKGRGAVYDPRRYRGIHLTCVISKVAERVLGEVLMPFFENTNAFGTSVGISPKERMRRSLHVIDMYLDP